MLPDGAGTESSKGIPVLCAGPFCRLGTEGPDLAVFAAGDGNANESRPHGVSFG